MNKVVVISGASSGIGRATAERLIKDGYIVYGSARKDSELKELERLGINPLKIEMTDETSMQVAIDTVLSKEGRIDVLFNNAGYGLYGTVEELSIEKARHQFEVNLFGHARMTQLVLPTMRQNGSGTIINTSSMGGKMYTPLGAWYHATKHAIEGWSDCLRLELKQFNIDVVIIEPGGIKTEWGSLAADNIEQSSENGAYATYAKSVANGLRARYDKNGSFSEPTVVANAVAKAIKSRRPKTRYAVGKYAKLLIFLREVLSDRSFDRIIQR